MLKRKFNAAVAFAFFLITILSCNSASNTSANDTTTVSKQDTTAVLSPPDSTASASDTTTAAPLNPTVNLIRNALTGNLVKNDLTILTEKDRKFIYSEADINGDGTNEIFVGMKGGYFCGNAGCTVYLLTSDGKEITRFTIVDGPIAVSADKTKDWNDLIMPSRGVNYLVKFNGKTYPSNPSVQPKFTGTVSNDLKNVLPDGSTAYAF
ncbi:MAG: hypothetical protein ACTHLE_03195 [Agriterribacter sp.]